MSKKISNSCFIEIKKFYSDDIIKNFLIVLTQNSRKNNEPRNTRSYKGFVEELTYCKIGNCEQSKHKNKNFRNMGEIKTFMFDLITNNNDKTNKSTIYIFHDNKTSKNFKIVYSNKKNKREVKVTGNIVKMIENIFSLEKKKSIITDSISAFDIYKKNINVKEKYLISLESEIFESEKITSAEHNKSKKILENKEQKLKIIVEDILKRESIIDNKILSIKKQLADLHIKENEIKELHNKNISNLNRKLEEFENKTKNINENYNEKNKILTNKLKEIKFIESTFSDNNKKFEDKIKQYQGSLTKSRLQLTTSLELKKEIEKKEKEILDKKYKNTENSTLIFENLIDKNAKIIESHKILISEYKNISKKMNNTDDSILELNLVECDFVD